MDDNRPVVLVVGHNRTDHCGVYQHGKRMVDILQGSEKYRFVGVRCDGLIDFSNAWHLTVKATWSQPVVTIYNYYPGTLDWCHNCINGEWPGVHIGMAHEITHADAHTPRAPFKRWIVTDPSFPDSDIYFKTVRPLPSYSGSVKPPEDRLTIGSFGYAFPNKGFEKVLWAAAGEFFADCTVRMHVTVPHFDGGIGAAYLEYLKQYLGGMSSLGGPRIELTTDHLGDQGLLDFLAGNHLNCLFYDENPGRGISSAVDWCVASGRPLAITQSEQFRHLKEYLIPWPHCGLRESLGHTRANVRELKSAWSHERFIADYEGIVDTLLGGSE